MKKPKLSLLFVTIILLVSCATPYKHDGIFDEGLLGGYTDTRLDANTVIVSFRGDVFTSWQRAHNFALYRAAEVTLHDGYDYFVLTNTSNRSLLCCMNVPNPHAFVAVIKMYQGNVPNGEPNSYDAKEVIAHLGPVVY